MGVHLLRELLDDERADGVLVALDVEASEVVGPDACGDDPDRRAVVVEEPADDDRLRRHVDAEPGQRCQFRQAVGVAHRVRQVPRRVRGDPDPADGVDRHRRRPATGGRHVRGRVEHEHVGADVMDEPQQARLRRAQLVDEEATILGVQEDVEAVAVDGGEDLAPSAPAPTGILAPHPPVALAAAARGVAQERPPATLREPRQLVGLLQLGDELPETYSPASR
jgi:hypothetical protein